MSCLHLSNRAFGNKNGSRLFGLDWVDGGSIACLEWVRKGVLHRSPWESRQLSSCGIRLTTIVAVILLIQRDFDLRILIRPCLQCDWSIGIKYIDRASWGEVQVNLAQLYVATWSCWSTRIKSSLSLEKVLPNPLFLVLLRFYYVILELLSN